MHTPYTYHARSEYHAQLAKMSFNKNPRSHGCAVSFIFRKNVIVAARGCGTAPYVAPRVVDVGDGVGVITPVTIEVVLFG